MGIESLAANLNIYASDALSERIRGMILSGELPEGYEFPKEEEFCRQLGVGRSTLREAFKVLNASGYIRRIKGHGTVVNKISSILETAPIAKTLKAAEIREVLEFREMLETNQAFLAAEKGSDEDIAALGRILKEMEESEKNLPSFSDHDVEFHLLVSKMSGNSLMYAIMKNLENVIDSTVQLAFQIDTEENVRDALAAHREIFEAIEKHQGSTASKKMRNHIQSVSARFFKKCQ